jgi:uncharacterized flavoprotein (TIGR03862 family)
VTTPTPRSESDPFRGAPTAVVIGGGPGGLMAAEVLATAGVHVTVVEHMPSVGRKFLLAGRSGLNLTHCEPLEQFLQRYGPHQPHLEHALRNFTPDDLRSWAADLGQPTFEGSSGRVFPEAFRATPLLRAWLDRLNKLGVQILTRHRWIGFGHTATAIDITKIDITKIDSAKIDSTVTSNNSGDLTTRRITPNIVILALGGASWPRVGSDGAWVEVLRATGLGVTNLQSSNAGVAFNWSDHFIQNWAGIPLKNVAVSLRDRSVRGDLMITNNGLEGGPIYAMNSLIRAEIAERGYAQLRINLHPDQTVVQISQRWTRRRKSDSLSTALRRTLGYEPVRVAWLRETTTSNFPTDAEAVAALVTSVPVKVTALSGLHRAISTAGGLRFDSLDTSFMVRDRPGVFAIGEMLDWDAPTGGYLLQATFSTAVAAARAAIARHTDSDEQTD